MQYKPIIGRVASSNVFAKTRALDAIVMDQRMRYLTRGSLGPDVSINIAVLFNLLPGATAQTFHSDDDLWPFPRPHHHLLHNCILVSMSKQSMIALTKIYDRTV